MLAELSTSAVVLMMAAAAAVIFICGLRMTSLADEIADRTGLGEAITGGILLGAATSLSGTVVSLTAALQGLPSLAFSNGIGGIAAQTAFLAIGDLVYRKANLEHAAAELANVFQCGLLIVLLAIPFLASTTPEMAFLGLHPLSYAIPAIYIFGTLAAKRVRENPMWQPVRTAATRTDEPDTSAASKLSSRKLYGLFVSIVLFLSIAGWLIARTGAELSTRIGMSETLVGALMTAIITSLPELVTTLTAVRRGALQLAVGGIIGGNMFDTLFLTLSDAAYRDGSIYHAVTDADYFWNATALVMSGVLLLGLVLRQRQGAARIGFESLWLLLIFGGGVTLQARWG